MKKLLSTIALVAFVATGLSLNAQQTAKANSTGGNSPHETTSAVVDGNRVTITYGRPYTKAPKTGEVRKIWGGLVPYGKAWRMGSDEATLLITQQPITLGGFDLPAGAYTLYMVPEESGASKLAISKKIGQWGVPVDEKNDLARVDLSKAATASTVDQFTMAVAKNPAGGGVIKLSWENAEYSVPFTVKK
ncbi:MAG TPA: DUF2911 domain-containing protein [Verrucomicrobiae bacterium]|nr:DUF2911 domain-containing protein [Verrucomicrobiae bacterium]